MIECYVKGRNLIDGVEERYNVADGPVCIDNYNETLDSATIILPQLDHEIEVEPFDVIRLQSKTGSAYQINPRYLCVDNVTCTQTCLNPARYRYEITLFSETKELEGVLCPSLKITRRANSPRSVAYYLLQYLNEYSPKITSSATQGAFANKFTYGHDIITEESWTSKFAVECPEMQWNKPTLREVITDLMMVVDCIPCVVNNTINFIDISHDGDEITNTQKRGINFITKSHSSADYVSELKMEVVNATDSKNPNFSYENEEGIEIQDSASKISEYIGFRNEGAYLVNDNSLRLETSYPIWRLHHLGMIQSLKAYIQVLNSSLQIVQEFRNYEMTIEINLTPYVLEHGEWQTKEIAYSPMYGTSLSTNYQNTCLYYKRGSKSIENFSATQEVFGPMLIPDRKTVYELIQEMSIYPEIRAKFLEEHPEYDGDEYVIRVPDNERYDNTYWQTKFICSYEPVCDFTFLASKEPFPRNKRQVVDNQNSSYVDVDRQGALEYLKAKRLGNKISLVNARYKGVNESALPKLGEKINGKTIFRRELSFNQNFINANFQTIENYVLRDYFTSVKSKIRSWKILSGNEASIRSDLIKFYVNENISPINNQYRKIPVYDSAQEYMRDFRYCAIRFDLENGDTLPKPSVNKHDGTNYGIDTYVVEFVKRKCGNSVVFTIRMADNAVLGRYVSKIHGNGGMEQQNCVYVDSDGENIGGTIWFFREYDPTIPATIGVNEGEAISTALKPGANFSQIGQIVAKIPFHFHKDNGEITEINIQFEFNDSANDIFLGKK